MQIQGVPNTVSRWHSPYTLLYKDPWKMTVPRLFISFCLPVTFQRLDRASTSEVVHVESHVRSPRHPNIFWEDIWTPKKDLLTYPETPEEVFGCLGKILPSPSVHPSLSKTTLREVPVLLQNRNGPCALLAIANGLLYLCQQLCWFVANLGYQSLLYFVCFFEICGKAKTRSAFLCLSEYILSLPIFNVFELT